MNFRGRYFQHAPTDFISSPLPIYYRNYKLSSEQLNEYYYRIRHELEYLHKKFPSITLSEIIHKSKIWKRYLLFIKNKSSGLRNKMLSKIAHHWNNS